MASLYLGHCAFPTRHNAFPSNTAHHRPLHFTNARPVVGVTLSSLSSRPQYIPNRIPDAKYVRIFDTTLRDGGKSPGVTMTTKEKLEIARQLARLGVDVIEAGFPASSDSDFEAVKLIAHEVGNADSDHVPVICGLARCNKADIGKAWEAVKPAKKSRIHTFIATSEIHMKYKLKMTPEEVIEKARSMVAYARSLGCDDVEFSPEDAGRSDREFLYQILGEVIKAGATTLNIPDTAGFTLPEEFGKLIADIKANTHGIENVIISTHCQNDLGLSTANTLAGAHAGARQLEVTINGIGERAGNASLEEVVMALKCRGEQVLGGLHTGIDTKYIVRASEMVEEYSGLRIQPHKAIVGANAFAHESGIHQDGMLRHKNTYEIISPEDIGRIRSSESGITLGKLSGRHALKAKMLELGYEVDGEELDNLFQHFKAIAGNKKIITDDDLNALVSDEVFQPPVVWKLEGVQVTCGPTEAAYRAVDLILKVNFKHVEDAAATTTNAIGKTVNHPFSGTGSAMDGSSVRADTGAPNKLLGFLNPLISDERIAHIIGSGAYKVIALIVKGLPLLWNLYRLWKTYFQ